MDVAADAVERCVARVRPPPRCRRRPWSVLPRPGPERGARIVAAMSGGVDSSVAAALLAREMEGGGDEVVGVWMRTHPDRGEGWEPRRGCCSSEAADDARRVADRIGIPFFVLNVEAEFGAEVIDAFADAYLDGTTPNPCQACNQKIKFDLLARRAVGPTGPTRWPPGTTPGSSTATGRGASSRPGPPRTRPTSCGGSTSDSWRDPLPAGRHDQARGPPAGCRPRPADRGHAESQEICFVPAGDYRALLAERRAYAGDEGPIVDEEGRQVGTHTGYAHYTVGQRRGLGLATGEARYVKEIRPGRTRSWSAPARSSRPATSSPTPAISWPAHLPAERFEAQVRIRHRSPDVACEVTLVGPIGW